MKVTGSHSQLHVPCTVTSNKQKCALPAYNIQILRPNVIFHFYRILLQWVLEHFSQNPISPTEPIFFINKILF